MTLSVKRIFIVAAVLGAALMIGKCRSRETYDTSRVERGSIEVWSIYIGTIESQNVRNLVVSSRGSATLTEIVPDGTPVTQGMQIARFDSSRWEDEFVESSKNLLLAEADYESLINAKLPLELNDLETKMLAASQKLSDEKQSLTDTRELYAEDLVPEYEVKQLEVKVTTIEAEIEGLAKTMDLTKRYLHPAAAQRAQASLDSASNAYVNIQRKIESSIVLAPCDGIALHKPTNIGGDYRSVRIGDTVWNNQVFMTISDMKDLIARCDVPEPELTRIVPGAKAVLRPIAYPEMSLTGTVLTVGAMAQQLPGRSDGAKFFEIVVKLDSTAEVLKSDMSAEVRILAHKADNVLLIPRSSVWWEDGKSYCYTVKLGKRSRKLITVGPANDSHFELLDGLEPGQKVVAR